MTFGVVFEDETCLLTEGKGGLATGRYKRNHSRLRIGGKCCARRESLLETPIQERAATRLTDSTKVQQIAGESPVAELVESYPSIHDKKGARAHASD